MRWPWSKPDPEPTPAPAAPRPGVFSTDLLPGDLPSRPAVLAQVQAAAFPQGPALTTAEGVAMDECEDLKAAYQIGQNGVPDAQLMWYGSQGFIGHQVCAILAQHWLIDRACSMPAKDAIRTGYDVVRDDGGPLPPEVTAEITRLDRRMNLNRQMLNFIRKGRIFGIRVALFKIDGIDYSKPFNPDGIRPGSYRGIVQIDPYWAIPELVGANAADPLSLHFYEPEFWNVLGQRVHRTHLVIFRTEEPADVLKPSYLYGGIPVPQRIYERVYGAERTANEAPQLALTKRLTVLGLDLEQATAQPTRFVERMKEWAFFRDNFGIKVRGQDDTVDQFDTSLTDLDAVIMTQYQIVAAAAGVPATKLMGTVPKGFNSTGDYEEASYHEELESLQTHDLTPFLERHHLCLMRSVLAPRFPELGAFNTQVVWRPLDTPTALEVADLNLKRAQMAQALAAIGAIDGLDERDRLTRDPDSGYTGLAEIADDGPEA